jgi:hypothetical protein
MGLEWSIIRIITSRRMRWAGHVARMSLWPKKRGLGCIRLAVISFRLLSKRVEIKILN